MSGPKASPFLGTWVALLVLTAVGAWVWQKDFSGEPKPDPSPRVKLLPALTRDLVTELRIEAAGSAPLRAVKEGATWRLVEPFAAPADRTEVESVLSSLEGLEIDDVVTESPARISDYGLDPAAVTVTLAVKGAEKPIAVLLGTKTPDSSGLYAKLPAEPRVVLVSAWTASSLQKKPFDLRDRSVLHVKRDQIQTLRIAGPQGAYALRKDSAGAWGIVEPVVTRTGRWAVDGLVGNLESLRMEAVAAEDAANLKPFGLDKPTRTVTLGLANGETRTLEFGTRTADGKDQVRDAATRLVALVPPALGDDLAKGLGELREKRLHDVSVFRVDHVELEGAVGKKVLDRSSTPDKDAGAIYHWKRTVPDGAEVKTPAVQDALLLLGGLEIVEFVDKPAGPATYGFDQPALLLNLRHDSPENPPATLQVGQKGDAWYARRQGDDAVLKLDAKKAVELVEAFKKL